MLIKQVNETIGALERARSELTKLGVGGEVIKVLTTAIGEINNMPVPIKWEQPTGQKYEVGIYRGFKITHHFRDMEYPYRVTIWGRTGDVKLFEASTEENIINWINNFYDCDWTLIKDSHGVKMGMLLFNNCLYLKTFDHIRADLDIFSIAQGHYHKLSSSDLDPGNLEKLIGGIMYCET